MLKLAGARSRQARFNQVTVGIVRPGFPYLRLQGGEKLLVYLPGLSDAFASPGEHPHAYAGVLPKLRKTHTIFFVGRSSQRPPGMGLTNLVDDIDAAIKSVLVRERPDDPSVDLAGSSVGGIAALAYAARHPDRISRISVNSAAHRLSTEGQRIVTHWLELATNQNWPALSDAIADAAFTGYRKRLNKTISRILLPIGSGIPDSPERLMQALQTMLAADLGKQLPKIRVPTQLVGGAHDPLFTTALMEEAASLIPYSDLLMFGSAGHGVAIEKRKVFEAEMTAFFQDGIEQDEET